MSMPEKAPTSRARAILGVLGTVVIVVLVMTGLIFIIMPRGSAPFSNNQLADSSGTCAPAPAPSLALSSNPEPCSNVPSPSAPASPSPSPSPSPTLFTVDGDIPVPNINSDPPNTSQSTYLQYPDSKCNPFLLAVYRGAAAASAKWMNAHDAPAGGALMYHFLGGTGTEVDLPYGSTASLDLPYNDNFNSLNKYVKGEITTQLSQGSNDVNLKDFLNNLRNTTKNIAPPYLGSPTDLYYAFRGTQGLTISGDGYADRTKNPGTYSGELIITIRDSYGFSMDDETSVPGGAQLRYLQTVCGNPPTPGGAEWFPDTVTYIEPLSGTLYATG